MVTCMVNSEDSKWALFQNHGIIMQLLLFTCNGTPEQSCVIRFGSRILTNCWSFSVGTLSFFFFFVKNWLWFRLQSISHKLILLWVDGFAINGRLRHKHAKKCWKLKDVELRCCTPLHEPMANWLLLTPCLLPAVYEYQSSLCYWEAYLSGVTFHFSWTQAI